MRLHFYALADDLLPIFESVESKHELSYCPRLSSSIATYLAGASLPSLRMPPPAANAIAGHMYLVTPRDVKTRGRRVILDDGSIRYAFDQMENPESIELLPGAWDPSGTLLYGRVATISESLSSKTMFNAFKRAIHKHFRRVNSFWVGPLAEEAWKNGARLTIGLDSPATYDLLEMAPKAV